jgi:hypothetical protein
VKNTIDVKISANGVSDLTCFGHDDVSNDNNLNAYVHVAVRWNQGC